MKNWFFVFAAILFIIWARLTAPQTSSPNPSPLLPTSPDNLFTLRSPEPSRMGEGGPPTTTLPSLSPTPPLPTSTPKPVGPCVNLPVLFYHHIQTAPSTATNGQEKFTVTTDYFKKHLEYLKSRGYTPITPADIVNFFDSNTPLPPKPVLLTFDDAYQDIYTDAFPLLKEANFKATIFVPTGLLDNQGYISWDQLKQMTDTGLIFAGNHTWSHPNLLKIDLATCQKEITTADTQLVERGLNSPKVFAYPYGNPTSSAEQVLSQNHYLLAFTTLPGRNLCKSARFRLPRLRIGNAPLSSYGL